MPTDIATYGLLGYPLGHSFSRAFFTEKFTREGIAAEYLNFELPGIEQFDAEVLARHPRLRGFNVTIPYKQAIIPRLDSLTEEAAAIGAVNVVRVEPAANGQRLVGTNSDWIGFTQSLRPLLQAEDREALILGTGGASRAVVYSLERLGIRPHLVSRQARQGVLDYAVLPQWMERCRLIVNCTPLGMFPHVDDCPPIPYEQITPAHLLYDLVYNPAETLFLRKGAERGARTKNGAEMLERQALAAWEFWQG